MTFANPKIGILFLVLYLLACFLCWKSRKTEKALLQTWGVLPNMRQKRYGKAWQWVRKCLFRLGFICLGLALARPQWGFITEKRQQAGLNVVFAIDTSKSMLANDVRPNRLELAKMSIEELLKSLKGNQVGLIAFAGSAFLQCPSTGDYGAFKLALQSLDTDIIPKGGTNLSEAMELAATIFDETARYKQIILLTDGENLSGDALKCAQKMAQLGITIHTVGIGSATGAPIGITNDRGLTEYLKDETGKTVITRLDEATLQHIAQITRGFYVPLGNAGEGLKQIYNTAIKHLPNENFESVEKVPVERYTWFASLALLCFLLEAILYPIKRKSEK